MATSSSRTLGKARVLGAGKPLPSTPSPAPALHPHVQHTDLLSPSASSLSLNSQQSTSKSSNEETDISSAVALQARDNVAAASASSRMVCPICNEEMVTLLQLNRHIDDAHRNLEDEEQDEVKTWFKTQMVKAKKFQPLAVLNQKLKGLDVFETNDDRRSSYAPTQAPSSGHGTPEPPQARSVDPDEIVTRDHWQRYTQTGACSDPMCGKKLGPVNGNINCRKCGKLFCEEDTMYQMKLSRSAQHEPVRGFWCRVCETCYKSREGFNDHTGSSRDHMASFTAIRRKSVDKSYLEISRLEKRLTKLTKLMLDPRIEQDQGTVGYLWSFSGAKSQRRLLEETVVDWEDDASITHCPFCQQEFTSYTFRRHHCRLCGRVVCADPITSCSTDIGLNVDAASRGDQPPNAEKQSNPAQISVDVRMCKDCKRTVFSKSDFLADLTAPAPSQRVFTNLKQFERGIRMLLPRFQKLLIHLQDPDNPPSPAQLTDATKVRKRLTDSFTQYDVAARRIRDLPTSSPAQQRLQRQVHMQASQFLHVHMLPLKSLPRILKHAAPAPPHSRTVSTDSSLTNGAGASHISTPNQTRPSLIKPPSETSTTSRLSVLESEEKSARDSLIVLEEQKFMVGEMLADAQRRRKFEEVESLGRNLDEVTRECDRLAGVLGGLRREVAEVWGGGGD
ncbi:MAG: carboxypeptidase Y-deficient [Chrysothrix sp. TS-e1954]|nr:MAG: carboxypeptidase Y-deficient [Chrysothrix sp. TS-e1954]